MAWRLAAHSPRARLARRRSPERERQTTATAASSASAAKVSRTNDRPPTPRDGAGYRNRRERALAQVTTMPRPPHPWTGEGRRQSEEAIVGHVADPRRGNPTPQASTGTAANPVLFLVPGRPAGVALRPGDSMAIAKLSAPLGRDAERVVLDRLLEGARAGRGSVLVVRGEAGVGKSSSTTPRGGRRDVGWRACPGCESDVELPFAGLADGRSRRCSSARGGSRPPSATRCRSRSAARGPGPGFVPRRAGGPRPAPDVADERPLVCIIDDAQWLDRASAQVLSFVARRLAAERIAMVFAVRETARSRRARRPAELASRTDRPRRALCCSTRSFPAGSTSRCASGSSLRRAVIRWPCSSFRAP